MQQTLTVDGSTITIQLLNGETETHHFSTATEAEARAKFILEAMTWAGTPFRDCADIKGREGGVDCAMLLVRASVDSGLLPPFDPRPYPPRWHMHQDRERFLEWIADELGGQEVATPRLGDVLVWKFGKCFSHGAIMVNSFEVLHAWYAAQGCLLSRSDEPLLEYLPLSGKQPRPVKYFDLWSAKGAN